MDVGLALIRKMNKVGYTPTWLTATRVPLCQVLVRFFPRMVMSTVSSPSSMAGLGLVGEKAGGCDTNTVGAVG